MFTRAITKKPCRSMVEGITTAMFSEGKPDYQKALIQHENYVKTLEGLGLEVVTLEADERYPDSCFVEDPAVVTDRFAVITNPAEESRNGEKYEIESALGKFFADSEIFHIEAPGTMEGGDVMQIGNHFFVGVSDRTNDDGARQFSAIVEKFGFTTGTIPVTEGLHLKDFVVYIDNENMLVTPNMDKRPEFAEYNRIVVDADELYAVNSLFINGTVIVPKGHIKTLMAIQKLGYPTIEIDTSEFGKIDGSLTCLSLRF